MENEKELNKNNKEKNDIKQVLESIPAEKRRIQIAAFQSSYTSPFPPPEVLKHYDEALKGSSERLLTMIEKEQSFRMETTKEQLRLNKFGQYFGFILAILLSVAVILLGINGHDVLAGTIATTTIIGLCIIFVLHSKPNKQ